MDKSTNVSKINILGTNIAAMNLHQASEQIMHWIEAQRKGYITITGVHGIIESFFSATIRKAHADATASMPDGMPLSWIGRMRGHKNMDRVYGPDLMIQTLEQCSKKGYSSFFYGGAEGVPDRLSQAMSRRFEGLRIAGTMSPPFRGLENNEEQEIINTINNTSPDIVWIGLSTPKQELLMQKWKGRIKAPIMIGVGAAFDFLSGGKNQAPRWMQRAGLEWLFRLCAEPKRLWKRYFFIVPTFLSLASLQLLGLLRFGEAKEPRQTNRSKTQLAPRFAILAMLSVTSITLLTMPAPHLVERMPVETALPDAIGEWNGAELFFCQSKSCGAATTTPAYTPEPSCPYCGGTLRRSWSTIEARMLPAGTIMSKKMYSHNDAQVLVTVVISGYERVGIHRPQMCLAGQGWVLLGEDSQIVELQKDMFRIRRLQITRPGRHGGISNYYYWFTDGLRTTDSHWLRMIYQTIDRVWRGKVPRWAYISIAPSHGLNTLRPDELELFAGALNTNTASAGNHESNSHEQ